MDLSQSIQKTGKQEIIIKSIIWNTIIAVFLEQKKIDITPYLVSIKILGENILIKTHKPIINTELYILNDIIKENIHKKIKVLRLELGDFEIKYV